MAISEEKMRIVINNYFKKECNVDTSIRQAFEKGFRIGVNKGLSVRPEHIQNNAVHLCDSCQHSYPTCPSYGNDVIFGDGKGYDNICACNKYLPKSVQPEITLESVIDYLRSIGWMQVHDKIMSTSAQSDLIAKIQNGIKVTNADDVYSCGMRNGMRWCISLIDDKEPLYENCPSAQHKPLKYTGESICEYCRTTNCKGCIYEPMTTEVQNG